MYVYHHFVIKHCIPFLKTLLCAWLSVSNSAALIHNRTDWGNCLTACAVTALAVSSGCNKIDTKNDMKPSKKLSVRIILLQRRGELNMVAWTTVLALIKSDTVISHFIQEWNAFSVNQLYFLVKIYRLSTCSQYLTTKLSLVLEAMNFETLIVRLTHSS